MSQLEKALKAQRHVAELEKMLMTEERKELDDSPAVQKGQAEPTLGNAIPEAQTAVRNLLEWMPICSIGSSGYQFRVAVEKAMQNLEAAWALATL